MSNNPFTAKVEKRKANPFSARIRKDRAAKLAELDAAVAQAKEDYEKSLNNALKKGITRDQINKLFNISDRHMHALMTLSKRRNELSNGQPDRRK